MPIKCIYGNQNGGVFGLGFIFVLKHLVVELMVQNFVFLDSWLDYKEKENFGPVTLEDGNI